MNEIKTIDGNTDVGPPIAHAKAEARSQPGNEDPFKKPDGELTGAELVYRLGLLLGAGLFLIEGQGAPWNKGLLPLAAAVLLSALMTLTMTLQWRVLGDWRRRSQQIVFIALALVLIIPLAAVISPKLGGSAVPDWIETPVEQIRLALATMPGMQVLGGFLKGMVTFAIFMVFMVAMLAATSPGRQGAFVLIGVLVTGLGVFFYPSAETIVGMTLLVFFYRAQWERALLLPDRLRPHLSASQIEFLKELVEVGALSTGETRLYLDNDPKLFAELLDFGLVDFDKMTREILPGQRLLHDPASESLEKALSVARRSVWILAGLIYFIMPDLVPGPLDDIIVMAMASGVGFGWIKDFFGMRRGRTPVRR